MMEFLVEMQIRWWNGTADSSRGENFVLRCGGDGGFGDGEELAADEPCDGGLGGALGDADRFGEVLIADRTAALLR